jgi:hypothetical protein
MTVIAPDIGNLSLNITEEIHVRSSLKATFAGSAIWATTRDTCGVTSKRSSRQRSSRSQDH